MASQANKDKFEIALMASTDKYVKQQGRNTVTENALLDKACEGYARVPGPDACDFCVTMGAQDNFYNTQESAGGGVGHGSQDDLYHAYCNCQIVVVFRKRGKLVARDPETGKAVDYDGARMVQRYNEVGRPTFKMNPANREAVNARRRARRMNGDIPSGKQKSRNAYAGTRLSDEKFDAAMKALSEAKTLDELKAVADGIVEKWPANSSGRHVSQWSKMSKFAKEREKALAAKSTDELRTYQAVVSVKLPDYSRLSAKQFKLLSENEKEGFSRLAELRHDVVVLPNVRSAPANIDMIMDGVYWELKTPVKDGGRLKTRIGEGVTKWERLKDSDIEGLGTPKIVVDNRFSNIPDKKVIQIIKECMSEFREGNFDEAMIIRKNGRTTSIKK